MFGAEHLQAAQVKKTLPYFSLFIEFGASCHQQKYKCHIRRTISAQTNPQQRCFSLSTESHFCFEDRNINLPHFDIPALFWCKSWLQLSCDHSPGVSKGQWIWEICQCWILWPISNQRKHINISLWPILVNLGTGEYCYLTPQNSNTFFKKPLLVDCPFSERVWKAHQRRPRGSWHATSWIKYGSLWW